MEIVYASQRHPLAEGRTFRNPRHFHTAEIGATKVWIVGDHPKVAAAYRKAGVPVWIVGKVAAAYRKAGVPVEQVDQNAPAFAAPPEAPVTPLPDDFQVPEDWREQPWTELRDLARRCGAPFTINREQAIEAIEEWLLKERADDGENVYNFHDETVAEAASRE